jgi:hypothetical protein
MLLKVIQIEFTLQVPLEEPISFYMIMYPVYCIAETLVIGTNRKRYSEENARDSYFSFFIIPTIAGCLMIGWNLIFEPIGIMSNLWKYPDGRFT